MPELIDSVPLHLDETRPSPPVAQGVSESIPGGDTDYITPPANKVITVVVQYRAVKKGMPMPYDLPDGNDES